MPDVVMKAPLFEKVLSSTADKATKAVQITFLAADNKKYTVDISAQCAALALTAIAANLGEILSNVPAAEHPPMQPIVVRSAQTAMRDNGAVALILTLESGAKLPLEFQQQNLAELSEQFAELATLADRTARH